MGWGSLHSGAIPSHPPIKDGGNGMGIGTAITPPLGMPIPSMAEGGFGPIGMASELASPSAMDGRGRAGRPRPPGPNRRLVQGFYWRLRHLRGSSLPSLSPPHPYPHHSPPIKDGGGGAMVRPCRRRVWLQPSPIPMDGSAKLEANELKKKDFTFAPPHSPHL